MKETTLDPKYIFVFQTMNSLFNFIFWFSPIEFLSKMMPCRCHLFELA
jgi:hypothetical protein